MDTQRLILAIALSFISLLLWDAWQLDHGAGQPIAQSEPLGLQQAMNQPTTQGVPQALQQSSGGLPNVAVPGGGQEKKKIIIKACAVIVTL